jgi:hypothetical protein
VALARGLRGVQQRVLCCWARRGEGAKDATSDAAAES